MTRPFTPKDLWNLHRVNPPLVARDGSFLIVAVRSLDEPSGQLRSVLYQVRTDGSSPRQITTETASSSGPALSNDGRLLAFVRKPLGAEKDKTAQLHVLPLEGGGEAKVFGDFPLGVGDLRFFPDGKRVCVVSPVLEEAPTLEGTRKLLEERSKEKSSAKVTEDRVYRFWDRWLTDGEVPHIFSVIYKTEV